MKNKAQFKYMQLVPTLQEVTKWNKARVKFLSMFICACIKVQIVCFLRLAEGFEGDASSESNHRRIQRFFSGFEIDFKLFGKDSIAALLADREFIGEKWLKTLKKKKIRFYIRIRQKMFVTVGDNRQIKAKWLFAHLAVDTYRCYGQKMKLGGNSVYISGAKVYNRDKKELDFVIFASPHYDSDSMLLYRKRWQIETMFRAFKSSGFNFEDTHLTDHKRLAKLLALVAAFVWAYKTGIYYDAEIKKIAVKKHGYKAKSFLSAG